MSYVFDFKEDPDDFGEYRDYDDVIKIFVEKLDSWWALIGTIVHEDLHRAIVNAGEETREEQDHFIIKLLCF